MVDNLTETIYAKHTFTGEESMELARRMASAEATISRKMEELKSVSTTIKADIAIQEGILHSCAEKLRSGYEMRPKEADVKYEKGVVKYVDKETGEILEERPMTQDEQLRLSGTRVNTESKGHGIDAEKIIREASKEE